MDQEKEKLSAFDAEFEFFRKNGLVSYRNGDDQSVEIREHFANLNEIIVQAKEIQQDVERLEASGILDHVSKGSTP